MQRTAHSFRGGFRVRKAVCSIGFVFDSALRGDRTYSKKHQCLEPQTAVRKNCLHPYFYPIGFTEEIRKALFLLPDIRYIRYIHYIRYIRYIARCRTSFYPLNPQSESVAELPSTSVFSLEGDSRISSLGAILKEDSAIFLSYYY